MICFIFNIAPHYRFPIFKQISEELNCDIYIGDKLRFPIKNADYHSIPAFRGIMKNFFIGPFYWQKGSLRLLFKEYDYYVTTGDVYCLSTWVLFLLAKLTRKKVCTWSHGLYGKESLFQHVIKKAYYSLQDIMFVYNERSINLMKKAGISNEKMWCIANSLDSDNDRIIRKELEETDIYKRHFGNDNPTIIYCGRLQRIKRLDLLIEAVHLLLEKDVKVNLVVVGEDNEGLALEDLVKERKMDDVVWFYGPCYASDILAEMFYNAMVCVSPGNVGLTAIHALSFGCPVITHDDFANQMPEFEAIKEGVTGSFFERDDVHSLMAKIKFWISDADKREKARQSAFHVIDKKWNVHYQVNLLKEVLC